MAAGRNVTFSLAWQSAFDQAASSSATAWSFNAEAGSAGPVGAQAPEVRALMGLDGDAIDPLPGPHDVAGSWQLPLCARQAGLWLRGLMGAAASTTVVGARGGFLFRALPVAGDTITVGATVLTFVAGAPGVDEIEIGATLLETVDNAVAAIDAITSISATDKGQIILIEHDTADTSGNTTATVSSAPGRIRAFAATLKGGGNTRHRFTDVANTGRPFATVEVAHGDVSGAYKYRMLEGHMVRSIAIPKERSGQARMTAEVLARRDVPGAAAALNAAPTTLTVAPFSHLGGSILVDGVCVGTIDSAAVSLGVDLTAEGFPACGVGDVAVIGEPIVGDTSAGLELTGRFPTDVLHAAAFADNPVAVELLFVNASTGALLAVHLPRVFLARPTLGYQGRGVISASFTGTGYRDATAGYRYRADLYSPVAAFS